MGKHYTEYLKGSEAERAAFFDGAAQMAAALGQNVPDDAKECHDWLLANLIRHEAATEARAREDARLILAKFPVKKAEFRGMLFDREFINDNGVAVDATGNAIEDSCYTTLPGRMVMPWSKFVVLDTETGAIYEGEEVANLVGGHYEKVRYIEIDVGGDSPRRVYENDKAFISELIAQDIKIGDPINRRYLTYVDAPIGEMPKEVSNKPTTYNLLGIYRDVIIEALSELGPTEHTAEATPILLGQTQDGQVYISTVGQYNLTTLWRIAMSAKIRRSWLNDTRSIYYIEALLTTMVNEDAFKDHFPDGDIMSYRDINDQALPGAIYTPDPITSWRIVPAVQVDQDYSADEALVMRRNYVRYVLLNRAAEEIKAMLTRDFPDKVLTKMEPDMMAAISSLTNTVKKLTEISDE